MHWEKSLKCSSKMGAWSVHENWQGKNILEKHLTFGLKDEKYKYRDSINDWLPTMYWELVIYVIHSGLEDGGFFKQQKQLLGSLFTGYVYIVFRKNKKQSQWFPCHYYGYDANQSGEGLGGHK